MRDKIDINKTKRKAKSYPKLKIVCSAMFSIGKLYFMDINGQIQRVFPGAINSMILIF